MGMVRCTRCGAPLPNVEDEEQKTLKCEYCDYVNIRPKHYQDERYNIATKLRQEAEFDQAIVEYEKLLEEDETDYTAHWGLLLCKYGIEYVEDPTTGKTLPTCHLDRLQEEPVQKEAHYIKALEYAGEFERKMYEAEARQIDEVRADIMAATKNQPPYDVFICYKSKDEWKHRTEDSVWAQDIYEELTKRGYRVFFADKTIELGMKYEPVIFHALYSASIMIVVGTRKEYLDSIWVKNEWSRYQKLTKSSNKSIFLAFKDMDPNCFPMELKPWQAQNLGQVGAMQDLISAVEKKLKSIGSVSAASTSAAEEKDLGTCARLLKNAETFLHLENREAAADVYRTLTKDYPEEYRGWWGLIVCETNRFQCCPGKESSDAEIVSSKIDTWFRNVKKLAPAHEFIELERTYLEYARLAARRDTQEYIQNKKEKISYLEGDISRCENKISEFDKEKEKAEHEKNTTINNLNIDKAACERSIPVYRKNIKDWYRNLILLLFILVIEVIYIIYIVNFGTEFFEISGDKEIVEYLAIFILLIGFLIVLGFISKLIDLMPPDELKIEINKAQETITQICLKLEQTQNETASQISDINNLMDKIKREVANKRADIWEERAALGRGEEAIQEEIYQDICQKIRSI